MKYVIIGSRGFIGRQILKDLKSLNKDVIGLNSNDIDLCNLNDLKSIKTYINDGDEIIFTAAKAPVKNLDMFSENIIMMSNFLSYIREIKVNKFLYVSSDAVYSDSKNLLTEKSDTNPVSLHGIMHLVRENMVKNIFIENHLILRPTLVYGFLDPHNGYGPNLFVRKSKSENQIKLFGNGEELRDHIDIRLVSELVQKIIFHERNGTFNLVSGNLMSFSEIANIIKDIFWKKKKIEVNILSIPRNGPMPHDGYRGFDKSKISSYIVNENLLDFKKNINYYIDQLN